MIPPLLAKAELSTAMPKSGGTYFFVERSLGSLLGSFAGFASWISITLKGAFALVGIGTFWTYINPEAGTNVFKIIALSFVAIFTIINLLGVYSSAKSQVILVMILLTILTSYIILGAGKGERIPVSDFFPLNYNSLFLVTGMVFVSFGGLTKITALAHHVRNPGKILPRGMFLSFIIVILIYMLVIGVTVRLLTEETFRTTLTPLTEGGNIIAGRPGALLLTTAALIAFATTANASILSASQFPAAMAKDGLLPAWMGKTNSKEVPVPSILITGSFMALSILLLNLTDLVKAASTMMLILFLLVNLSLILMRESRIVSYRPEYKSPLYPILPILGILINGFLIYSMGSLSLLLACGFFIITTIWTISFRHEKPKRDSALFRIVERMAAREIRGARLSEELSEILRERDGIDEDQFDQLIRKAIILAIPGKITQSILFEKLAGAFSLRLNTDYAEILKRLKEREDESTTLITENLAIPHIVLDEEEGFEIVLVRAREGIFYGADYPEPNIVFALAGSASERNFHLQCLMAIAQITRTGDFQKYWEDAFDEEELRLLVLLAERSR